jgi:hypothetical protein
MDSLFNPNAKANILINSTAVNPEAPILRSKKVTARMITANNLFSEKNNWL